MGIRNFLDSSTSHITKKDSLILDEIATKPPSSETSTPRVIKHEYGWFIHVDMDHEQFVDDVTALIDRGVSMAFIKIYKHAWNQDCWWINFDRDGEAVTGHRRFNW